MPRSPSASRVCVAVDGLEKIDCAPQQTIYMLGLVTSSRPPALLSVPPATHGDLLGGSGRSKLLWDILRQGEDPFADASPIGKKFRRALEASFIRPAYHLIDEASSECGTRKLLLSLPDTGSEVETVIIPSPNGEFSTLCVSSQVGCRQACSFCATGTMGLVRSLGAEEIVAQVHAAAACIRGSRGALPPLRNMSRCRCHCGDPYTHEA